jgi:CD109 antigen
LDNQYIYDAAVNRTKDNEIFYDAQNRNYVISLNMENNRECDEKENKICDDIANAMGSDRSNDGVNYYSTEGELPKEFNINNPGHDPGKLRNNFLKTWIWTTNVATDGTGLIREEVPDSLTTWLFAGISMNPKYGLAIAEPQELVVSKKFFIELNLPYSIRIGEILTLDIIIFNFLSQSVTTDLKVYSMNNENTQQFKFKKLSGHIDRCSFDPIEGNVLSSSIETPMNLGTRHEVLIEPIEDKEMSIRVSIKTKIGKKTYEDYVEKKIVVENEGIYDYNTENAVFNSATQITNEVKKFNFTTEDINPNSVELKAIVTGNMMTNVLKKEQTQE